MLLLTPLLLLLTAAFPFPHADDASQDGNVPLELGPARVGRVTWGRNSLKLSYRNDTPRAVRATVTVRTRFDPPGSGVPWEATYEVLLPPEQSGEVAADYFVRPDHGTMRLEVEARA